MFPFLFQLFSTFTRCGTTLSAYYVQSILLDVEDNRNKRLFLPKFKMS